MNAFESANATSSDPTLSYASLRSFSQASSGGFASGLPIHGRSSYLARAKAACCRNWKKRRIGSPMTVVTIQAKNPPANPEIPPTIPEISEDMVSPK
jgi:hypothetical protein